MCVCACMWWWGGGGDNIFWTILLFKIKSAHTHTHTHKARKKKKKSGQTTKPWLSEEKWQQRRLSVTEDETGGFRPGLRWKCSFLHTPKEGTHNQRLFSASAVPGNSIEQLQRQPQGQDKAKTYGLHSTLPHLSPKRRQQHWPLPTPVETSRFNQFLWPLSFPQPKPVYWFGTWCVCVHACNVCV